jgi:cyclic beta-1,2-glucan synthetase
MPLRIITQTTTPQPKVQLLSNGRYHVMVTSAGGSYSRWKDLAVTRWREDATCDDWGNFCYVRDSTAAHFWSDRLPADPGRAEEVRSDLLGRARRIPPPRPRHRPVHRNRGVARGRHRAAPHPHHQQVCRASRTIEFTSYAEVVMAPAAADDAHPAFSKLFVQTEILRNENAILCTRRPRAKDEQMPWLLNLMTVHDGVLLDASFETSRAEFIGRGNSTVAPLAMRHRPAGRRRRLGARPGGGDPLQGHARAGPGGHARRRHRHDRDARSGPAPDRQIPGPPPGRPRVRAGLDPQPGGAAPAQRHRVGRAAVQPPGQRRHLPAARRCAPTPASSRATSRGQSGLWAYAISGDLPIVLMQIKDPSNIDLARQMVQAHAYWRLKGLVVDLVIWYEDQSGYRQRCTTRSWA